MEECIDELSIKVISKAQYIGFKAKEKLNEFITKENGDVNVVSIVILIGIAVVLALLFKDKITKIVEDLLKKIGEKANNAI
ncbi:MAG: Flp1 family type IVb pilin [Coprococcus sp.]